MSIRYVLVHPEYGIYLGNALGLGFWTRLDPIDQPSAVTFESPEAAIEHVAGWDEPLDRVTTHAVQADDGVYASENACIAVGLSGWTPLKRPN